MRKNITRIGVAVAAAIIVITVPLSSVNAFLNDLQLQQRQRTRRTAQPNSKCNIIFQHYQQHHDSITTGNKSQLRAKSSSFSVNLGRRGTTGTARASNDGQGNNLQHQSIVNNENEKKQKKKVTNENKLSEYDKLDNKNYRADIPKDAILLFENLLQKVQSYCPTANLDIIAKAFEYVVTKRKEKLASSSTSTLKSSLLSSSQKQEHYHRKQKQKEQKYIDDDGTHVDIDYDLYYYNYVVGVAHIIADMKLDVVSLVSGILSCFWTIQKNSQHGHGARNRKQETGTSTTVTSSKKENNNKSSLDLDNKNSIRDQRELLEETFGSETYAIVNGIIKINNVQFYHTNENNNLLQKEQHYENYRKMIVAIAKDIRVVLIKLAEQTYTVRTIIQSPSLQSDNENHNNRKIAAETLEVYAPLAHRLGIYKLKTELEDNCLQYLQPNIHKQLQESVEATEEERQLYTNGIIKMLKDQLVLASPKYESDKNESSFVGEREEGKDGKSPLSRSSVQVTGRAKSYYSIYQKMIKKNIETIHNIYDIMAFRILVNDIGQCYEALSIVHANWEPIQGRFKDYIANPKSNGYQSLHTTVWNPKQDINSYVEVQIRTYDMHTIAESGIAAHWQYKKAANNSNNNIDDTKRFTWLRELVDWVQQMQDPKEFITNGVVKEEERDDGQKGRGGNRKNNSNTSGDTKLSVLERQKEEEEVYVFTPKGDLFALAKGSCIIDFAYRIHTEVGNSCCGGKVNGKLVPLKYNLCHGDVVEIVTSNNQKPSRQWLNYVKSTKSISKIQSYIKKEEEQNNGEEIITMGRIILEKELNKCNNNNNNNRGMMIIEYYRENLDEIVSILKLSDERELYRALGRSQQYQGSGVVIGVGGGSGGQQQQQRIIKPSTVINKINYLIANPCFY